MPMFPSPPVVYPNPNGTPWQTQISTKQKPQEIHRSNLTHGNRNTVPRTYVESFAEDDSLGFGSIDPFHFVAHVDGSSFDNCAWTKTFHKDVSMTHYFPASPFDSGRGPSECDDTWNKLETSTNERKGLKQKGFILDRDAIPKVSSSQSVSGDNAKVNEDGLFSASNGDSNGKSISAATNSKPGRNARRLSMASASIDFSSTKGDESFQESKPRQQYRRSSLNNLSLQFNDCSDTLFNPSLKSVFEDKMFDKNYDSASFRKKAELTSSRNTLTTEPLKPRSSRRDIVRIVPNIVIPKSPRNAAKTSLGLKTAVDANYQASSLGDYDGGIQDGLAPASNGDSNDKSISAATNSKPGRKARRLSMASASIDFSSTKGDESFQESTPRQQYRRSSLNNLSLQFDDCSDTLFNPSSQSVFDDNAKTRGDHLLMTSCQFDTKSNSVLKSKDPSTISERSQDVKSTSKRSEQGRSKQQLCRKSLNNLSIGAEDNQTKKASKYSSISLCGKIEERRNYGDPLSWSKPSSFDDAMPWSSNQCFQGENTSDGEDDLPAWPESSNFEGKCCHPGRRRKSPNRRILRGNVVILDGEGRPVQEEDDFR